MLVQIENINEVKSIPLDKRMTAIQARDLYGSRIEGERVVVYDNNDNRYQWEYRNGKYREC